MVNRWRRSASSVGVPPFVDEVDPHVRVLADGIAAEELEPQQLVVDIWQRAVHGVAAVRRKCNGARPGERDGPGIAALFLHPWQVGTDAKLLRRLAAQTQTERRARVFEMRFLLCGGRTAIGCALSDLGGLRFVVREPCRQLPVIGDLNVASTENSIAVPSLMP